MALTDQLVSYWTMDEASGTRNDSTANANHLTQTGTISAVSGVISNGASNNNSTSNYLQDTSLSGWPTGTSDRSYSFWVKTTGTATQNFIVNTVTSTGSRVFTTLLLNASGVLISEIAWVSGGNQGFQNTSTFDINDGNWHHIVQRTYNEGGVAKADLIVDNATPQTASHASLTFDFGTSMTRFMVGALFNWSTGAIQQPVDGSFDEIGFWSRKITDAEVTQLYNSGAGLAYPFIITTTTRQRHTLLTLNVG